MGFEDARDDFWRGRDSGPHSKLGFLRALVEHGAVMTGRARVSGYECEMPYEGALGHAELLVLEGFAERASAQSIQDVELLVLEGFAERAFAQSIQDVVIWLPTVAGKRHLETS